MKKMLLYGFPDGKADRIQNAAAELGIPVYIVGDQALDEPLDELFDNDDDLETAALEFQDEYMIMQDVTIEDLMELIEAMKKEEVHDGGIIKAMKTDTNKIWSLRRLLKETKAEHDTARKSLVLVEMLRSCSNLDLSLMPKAEQEAFRRSLMDAFTLLDSGSYTETDVDECLKKVSDGLKKAHKLYS